MKLRQRQRTRPTPEPPSLLAWTQSKRPLLGPDKPVDFAAHPYLLDIYNTKTKRLVIYKASQMGASEYLISYAFHAADQRQATILYVFPTDVHLRDFSAGRIGPAIAASDYLTSIVVPAHGKGADRTTLKRVRNRFLYLRGGKVAPDGSAPQLKAVDADVLILDEVDEMDRRAPTIAEKRLGASRIAEVRLVSTPTYHDIGIHSAWQLSDQREWHIRCWRCGERQPLTINSIVTEWDELERPTVWHGQREDRAWIACRTCGRELNHLAQGEWIATRPGVKVVGFHLTRLFSPVVDLLAIVEALNTVDETVRKEAFNQDLGLPYIPRGGKLTSDVLDACIRDYGLGPKSDEVTTAGVDVGSVLNMVIRGPADAESGERPLRYATGVATFDELATVLTKFKVKTCVIDALPETRKARELQSAFPLGVIWLAYYSTQRTGSKKLKSVEPNVSEGIVNLDRTRTLDEMFAQVYAGTRTLPLDIKSVSEYYKQMQASVRVVEKSRSGESVVARYVKTGSDHYCHAENYENVAASGSLMAGGSVGIVMLKR